MSGTLDILERLVAFDTVSARSNLHLVAYVQDFLLARGFRVTRLAAPNAPKAGLYAEIGPPGAGLLLSAHSDVVPVEGQAWRSDPFRLRQEGGRLYGRGTTDMKGFVAAMLTAADVAHRRVLRAPFALVLSYDEEVGCQGISQMMPRLSPLMGRPRLVLVGEPTGMKVVTGHKGKRAYRVAISGDSGHSAMAPRYVNALQIAADFIQELNRLQGDLATSGACDDGFDVPYSTVHVGKLEGGRALNIVPDRADMELEFRHLHGDAPDPLEQRLHAAAADVCAAYGPKAGIVLDCYAQYPAFEADPKAAPARDLVAITGAGTGKVGFGTEAGFFAKAGLPTLVCGPGSMEEQGHKADEYLELTQLNASKVMLDRLMAQML